MIHARQFDSHFIPFCKFYLFSTPLLSKAELSKHVFFHVFLLNKGIEAISMKPTAADFRLRNSAE